MDLAIGAFDDMGAGVMQRMLFRQGYATLFRQAHPTAHAGMGLKAFRAERHLIVSRAAPGQVNQSMERAGLDMAEHFSVPHFRRCRTSSARRTCWPPCPKTGRQRGAALRPALPDAAVEGACLANQYVLARRYDRDGGNLWLRGLIVDAFAVGR